MPKPVRKGRQMSTRAFARAPSSVDVEARTFSVTASTETPVRTYIEYRGSFIQADEVLKADGVDLSRAAGMPLVDTHNTYSSISNILGRVANVRVEGNAVIADAQLNSRNADLIGDIAEGHYAQVSVGYYVDPADYDLTERDGDVPLATAKRWTLFEISLVPVGADVNASVRARRNMQENDTMDELEQAVSAAEQAMEALDAALETAGDNADAALVERAKALRAMPEDAADENKDAAGDGKGADAASADDKKEGEAVRGLRSLADAYGKEAVKLVDDLAKLGQRSTQIKPALAAAIAARAASGASTAKVEPQKQRSDDSVLDTRSIYERRNKR